MHKSDHSDSHQHTGALVAHLRNGDAAGGALLNELFREPVQRFCWGYLGRTEESEDAWQEVCYRVLVADSVPSFFRPWLYKIARNVCLNMLRARANRKDGQALVAESEVQEVLTGHLTRMVRSEQRSSLSTLVGSLTPEQREVLRLRYVEELSRAEIAEVLDLTEGVVKSRLFEGMRRLRESAGSLETD